LIEKYGPVDRLLANIPKTGLLSDEGDAWAFKRHGVGVEFRKLADDTIIDAHEHIGEAPECFDAWRLVEFFESRHIRALSFGGELYDGQSGKSVDHLLSQLVAARRLRALDQTNCFALE